MTVSRKRLALILSAFGGAVLVAAPAAAASAPTLLGVFKEWAAYTAGTGSSRVCYALSQPVSTEPKGANRDPIFVLISDWPGRGAKAEPQVVPGYPYQDGSTVTAQVGSERFTFFTKNESSGGAAWVKDAADEARLVDAMRKGSRLVVNGTSSRGTATRDSYSLSGISAALDKVHAECKM